MRLNCTEIWNRLTRNLKVKRCVPRTFQLKSTPRSASRPGWRDFERAFESCDVIATPVAPTTAFALGEKISDPLQMYLSDIFTISVNLAGLPGLSVPCGFDAQGLPIGLQLIGPPFGEEAILRAADAFERTGTVRRRPAIL